MIPVVDQICDIRDIIANGRKISNDSSDTWAWVALVFTLIGLIPTFGSLIKGCLKVLFSSIRRTLLRVTRKVPPEMISRTINKGVQTLVDYLQTPAVKRALEFANIKMPLKKIANVLDDLRKTLTVKKLNSAFDTILTVIKELMDYIIPWLPTSSAKKCQDIWNKLLEIRKLSDKQLANALGPVNDILEKYVNKLNHENGRLFRAANGDNFHKIYRIGDNDIIEQGGIIPAFYYNSGKRNMGLTSLPHYALEEIKVGFPNSIKTEFSTFSEFHTAHLEPGTKLVRIVDPKSADNSFCWMRLEEFEKLESRDQWRDVFAVKTEWNSNGEYIMYTVPEHGVMKVWEGVTATQDIKDTNYFLRGGGTQIVVQPEDLDPLYLSQRKPTNWGYGEIQYIDDNGLIHLGVPDLTKEINYWRTK